MRVNLRGMFKNICNDTPANRRSYHQACLDDLYGHLQGVIDGQYTLKEFAECYCLEWTREPATQKTDK